MSKNYKPKEFNGVVSSEKKIVIYTRVSTSNQKYDLKNQVDFLKQYASVKGIIVDEVIEDYGRISSRYNFHTSCF